MIENDFVAGFYFGLIYAIVFGAAFMALIFRARKKLNANREDESE